MEGGKIGRREGWKAEPLIVWITEDAEDTEDAESEACMVLIV